MKQTDHPKKKPQPKEGTGRKTALLGGNSSLGDSHSGGTSGKAASPVPTSPMLSLPHPQQPALCQTPAGRHWMLWHRRKPAHRVDGETRGRCGGAPRCTSSTTRPARGRWQQTVGHHREPQEATAWPSNSGKPLPKTDITAKESKLSPRETRRIQLDS